MKQSHVAALVLVVLAGAAGLWLYLGRPDLGAGLDSEALEEWVTSAGALGPVVVVGLMALAVVASPLPSAPVAMAAGAAYGHAWGTLWVILGAEAGALVAFALARMLGRDAMRRWFGDKVEQGFLGSQNALTLMVFASRLMPFVSFDLVSYAAGLSVIRFWRFALATLAGIAPASFLLAHLGAQAVTDGLSPVDWALAVGLGAVTGAPLVWAALRGRGPGRGSGEG
ncbi:TVP38/TMEM64 family protein [Roseivivax marinus]|uniref:TVP38/TMEM64 family protein n=1 Tax=Roseivivax marinus TaxID=1379903 RepID=UPI00273DEE8E|nr:TVP38/TMEM64 family protein [Roseivivax marinus]